jgi:exodeoxyribonuclease V alpha subunit
MIESSTMVGRIGDRVINRVNCTDLYWDTHVNDDFTKGVVDRGEGVFNGSIGTVVAFYPRSVNKNEDEAVLIRLDDGHFVMVESSLYVNWTLAYALTVHSAQGSEAHYVVLGLPAYEGPVSPWLFSGCNPFLSKNMIYTGITRAKLGVSIFGSIDIINRAIDSNIVPHNTCLAESLL